jgi:hypothetical protein
VVSVAFALLLIIFLLGLFFLYRNYRSAPKTEEDEEGDLFTDRSLMTLAVAIMVLTAGVILLIMVKNVDMGMTANYIEFNQKMSFFMAAILIALSLCLIYKWVKGKWMTRLAVGLIVSSVGLGIVMYLYGPGLEIGLVVPSALVAIAISVERIMRSQVTGSFRKTLYRAGPQIMHFGVALMLLAVVVSTNAQSVPVSGEFNKVPVGGSVSVNGYEVKVTGVSVINVTGVAGQRYDQVRMATVDLYHSGQLIQSGVELKAMYMSLFGDTGKVETIVFVYSAALEDIYLTYDWVDNSTANIQMKEVPLMAFLWTGSGLMAVGMALRFFAAKRESD